MDVGTKVSYDVTMTRFSSKPTLPNARRRRSAIGVWPSNREGSIDVSGATACTLCISVMAGAGAVGAPRFITLVVVMVTQAVEVDTPELTLVVTVV